MALQADQSGRLDMVDVTDKPPTRRTAVARGKIRMSADTLAAIIQGTVPKGDVLQCARLAGIQAAKRTAELLPLCHPLYITHIQVDLEPNPKEGGIDVAATVTAHAPTGVEMEALTAVSVAALCVYDMCKGLDRSMVVEGIRLVRKSGGRSGDWESKK